VQVKTRRNQSNSFACSHQFWKQPTNLPRDLSSSFYRLLKTFLFNQAWAGSFSEVILNGCYISSIDNQDTIWNTELVVANVLNFKQINLSSLTTSTALQ